MKKYTLLNKIKKLYFIGVLIIILILIFIFYFISSKIYINQMYKFCENILTLNLNLLNQNLINLKESQRIITNDTEIKKIVAYRKNNNNLDYSIELYNKRYIDEKFILILNNLQIENAYIVDEKGKNYYYYKHSIKDGVIAKEDWFLEIIENVKLNSSYISKIHKNNYTYKTDNKDYISMVTPIGNLELNPKVYFICDISLNSILYTDSYDVNFALVDSSNQLYILNNEYSFKLGELNYDGKLDKLISNYVGKNILTVSEKSKFFGIKLISIKLLNELEEIKVKIFIIFIFIIFVVLLLLTIISNSLSKIIVTPIDRLIEKCKIISKGDYNINFSEEKIYEINLLSKVIEDMIQNILFLNNKIIEEEKNFSKQKIRALQHQINPHFINNILQAIKSLAIEGNTDKISILSTLLGKIMAYSIYQPYNSVTIKEELLYIKNYIEIQNIRFNNKILYYTDCNEKLSNVKILKLTLQPIVENCIEHGLKTLEKGMITISVEEEKDGIFIVINDNGVGVDDEKLQDLQKNLASGEVYLQEKSIGILNVNERIKKKYGDDYGLEFISKQGIGTNVIIKLPKDLLKGESDEGINSR